MFERHGCLLLQVIVLEDKEDYMKLQSEQMQEKLDRRPFGPIVVCNPILKPIGKKGFRYWEGCLSVAGYQVMPNTSHVRYFPAILKWAISMSILQFCSACL